MEFSDKIIYMTHAVCTKNVMENLFVKHEFIRHLNLSIEVKNGN